MPNDKNPPAVGDFVRIGTQHWLVCYILYPGRKLICFRDGVRKTIEQ